MKWLLKSSILFFIMVLVVPLNARHFYWGITGGLNITRIHSNVPNVVESGELRRFSARQRLAIGGVLGLSLGDHLCLQLEPMYLEKGGVLEGEFELFIKYSTLEIPLLLKLSFGDKWQPHFFLGPSCSIVLDSEWVFTLGDRRIGVDSGNVTRRFDLGIVLGAGIGFPLWKGTVFLNCRYNLGLLNTIKAGTIELETFTFSTTIEIFENDEIKSEGFQIMVGYTLPLGK
jgi:hypothetical protein